MKRILYLFIILFSFCIPISCLAKDFDITGENVILYNLNDNTILYEKNSDEKTSIASLTKIMSALVALDNIDDLNETITITANDFIGTDGYSKAGFSIGDIVTYEDLLYGVLLPSGADAINALVNNTLGYDDFITAMNEKTKEIGLSNTKFSNPIGKDDTNNYSTASDIAKMLKYALNNDTFKEVFTAKEYTTSNGIILKSTLMPYKNILDINKIDGSKSGFTKEAGRCLASITNLNDVNYLLVVINSSLDYNYSAVKDTLTIYDYFNDNYSYQVILDDSKIISTLPVKWSKVKSYDIAVNDEVKMYLENGTSENLEYEFVGIKEINKDVKFGSEIGKVKIYSNGELIYSTSAYLNSNIDYYPSLLSIILIIIIFIILLKLILFKKRKKKRK